MSARSRVGAGVLVLALVALAGWGDRVTGDEVAFTLFYLVPVAAAALFVGRAAGLAIAALSAVLGFTAASGALSTRSWNALTELAVYASLAWLLTDMKRRMEVEAERAVTDPLTGLPNRRGFREAAVRELARARRAGQPVTLALVDVDDFKLVNDRLGHDAGDEVLRTLSAVLQGRIRAVDVAGRLGGDEFVLLLAFTSAEPARVLLGDLVDRVRAAARDRGWPIALSIGAMTFAEAPADLDGALREVDVLMYEAKRIGKGQVLHHTAVSGCRTSS